MAESQDMGKQREHLRAACPPTPARLECQMSRREILKYAGAGTAAAVLAHVSGSAGSSHLAHAAQACAAAADTQRSRRPNILFLMDDEHRGDCLGCDGNKAIKTPNLDRLASEGAMFSKAYCSLPSCTPARASLLTGMSPWSHGLLGYGNMAERYPIEKPRLMREAGYHAMAIGKMHFNPPRNTHGYNRTILEESFLSVDKGGFQCDYAQYFETHAPGLDFKATGLGFNDRLAKPYPYRDELHPTYFTAQTAIDFLNAYNEDKPFFLKVSFQQYEN